MTYPLPPLRHFAGGVYGVLVCNVQPHSRGCLVGETELTESYERREGEQRHLPHHYPTGLLRLDANYFDDDRDAVVMFNAMTGWK